MQQVDKLSKKIAEAKRYQIIISVDEDLKQETFKLRYQMLSEIHPPEYHRNLLPDAGQLEKDKYDNHSLYCVIKLQDKIVGTGRIILGQKNKPNDSLKVQNFSQHFFKDFSYTHIPIERVVEFSRLFVLPEHRKSGAFLAILKGRIALCNEHNISHVFLDAEPSLALKCKEYGLEYKKVSEEYNDLGMIRAAHFMSLQPFLNNLYEKNRELWEFITEEGKYYPYKANQIASINASSLECNDSSKFEKEGDIKLPIVEHDGRIRTLNGKGFMFPIQDQITKEFLEQIPGKRVVEIGAAYGNTIIEGLKRGCAHYTAVDLEQKHLELAAVRIREELKINGDILKQTIDFRAGRYPTEINLQENSYDAILAIRVIHFLTPDEFEQALSDFYRILKPGGRVYILSGTPYVKLYETFIPIYEQRKKEGVEYPGYVDTLYPYATPYINQESTEKYIAAGNFMFLDAETLHRKFSQAGFKIEKCCELPLPYSSEVWQYDGRENVCLIAQKP